MPRQFLPKNSGPHRIACKALYRALLEQCSRLELPPRFHGLVNPIKVQIRKQFDRNRNEVGAPLVVKALKIGYEAEQLLRAAANGDESSYSKILGILDEMQSTRDASQAQIALHPLQTRPHHRKPEPYPIAPRVLDSRPRPLSQLSGRRYVPVLATANGLPYLRFKKPQSPFLSRMLRNKMAQRQRLLDRLDELQVGLDWAEGEQQWEGIVDQSLEESGNGNGNRNQWANGRRNVNVADESWGKDMRLVQRGLRRDMHKWEVKAQAMSLRMLKIVDEEKALWEEEREARRRESRRERFRKKNLESSRLRREERYRQLVVDTTTFAASAPISDPGTGLVRRVVWPGMGREERS